MTFWARLSIYAGVVLLYVGTAAWIVRAWIRKRYRDKHPSDLHYIAVGIVLVRFGRFANRGGAWLHRVRDRPNFSYE
jgi:hypothetical protein